MPEKNPSEQESLPSWPVTYDKKGNLLGLPPNISERDVIVFIGNDGRHYAQLSSPELIEEQRLWQGNVG